MARKPNYLGITITCGRCKETVFLPSELTKRIVSVLRRQLNISYAKDEISDVAFLGNIRGLEQFDDKF